MYALTIITQFAAAHQLRGFHGGCEQLHGHNWKVEVTVRGPRLGPDGLLMDFQEIKAATREALEALDHRFLNEIPWFREKNPSSENIARELFEVLARVLNREGVEVYRVTAWESDTACASYLGPSADAD